MSEEYLYERKKFVEGELTRAVRRATNNIKGVKYKIHKYSVGNPSEYVVVEFKNGLERQVNISGDSLVVVMAKVAQAVIR